MPMNYKQKNGYRCYSICRLCYTPLEDPVIELGKMPLAGGFLISRNHFDKEKLYPLSLSFCKNCYALQTREVIPANTLFKNYFYFSSAIKTLVTHFTKTVDSLAKQYDHPSEKLLVEIGCNDGTFIKAALRKGFRAVGVDPATNVVKPLIAKGLPIINDYFTIRTAKNIIEKYGKADLIFSSNTLAHIEDMHSVMDGIKILLNTDGSFIFEVHYLGNLLKEKQYDMIYHEHQYYWSLIALQKFLSRFFLEIYDAQIIPIHAGSIQVFVQHVTTGKRRKTKRLALLLQKEKLQKLDCVDTFTRYNKEILKTKEALLHLLHTIKKQGKTVAGYGASGRGTIIMNYCGLDSSYLEYVIDDAPAKAGLFTPGNHLQIVPSNILKKANIPDYVVVFAWAFLDEIKQRNKFYIKNGGKFIVPLPEVIIVP